MLYNEQGLIGFGAGEHARMQENVLSMEAQLSDARYRFVLSICVPCDGLVEQRERGDRFFPSGLWFLILSGGQSASGGGRP
jgi:hypothetical protein